MRKDLYQDLYKRENTHFWHVAKRELVNQLLDRFAQKRSLKILDIGCGTGRNIETLKTLGDVWGIDISKQALAFCKRRGIKNVKLAPAHNTGFPKEHFDIVTMLDVLEHTDEQKTLQEVYRITKKDGLTIATLPAFGWLWSRWDEVLGHKKRYTKRNLEEAFRKAGFRIILSSYMYSYLTFPVFIIRWIKSHFFGQNYGSDFAINVPVVNYLLLLLARLERVLVVRGLVSFGTSLVTVAQKT